MQPFTLRWAPAMTLKGGGTISHYEIVLDGVVRRTTDASTTEVMVTHLGSERSGNEHRWRVRAVSTLGNAGGWSLRQTFH